MPYGDSMKGKKPQLYFGKKRSVSDRRQKVSCGQCIGCRLDKSREWALRCYHEAQYHNSNSFITLTFANDPVSLTHEYFQAFMKRLRRRTGEKLLFYMCGEYGSVYDGNGAKIPGALGRPHFHAILFGYDFPDRKFWKKSNTGFPIYNSEFLEDVWGHGYATTQDFSLEAAAYVARYVTKKVTGDQASRHYEKFTSDGEIIPVKPEYTKMSLKPAIGKKWMADHASDLYPKDFVTAAGIKFRPPKYYDKIFEDLEPAIMAEIKEKRAEHAQRNAQTPERLAVMEICKEAQASRLERPL
jgi:hypothetical protein